MPIRQPKSGESPAASACSSSVPSAIAAVRSLRRKRSVPVAVAPSAVASTRGGREGLAEHPVGVAAELGPHRRGGVDQAGRPTDGGAGAGRIAEELGQHGCIQPARIDAARGPVGDSQGRVAGRQRSDLGLIEPVGLRPREVQEADLTVVALVDQGAQHRQHGRDAAARR